MRTLTAAFFALAIAILSSCSNNPHNMVFVKGANFQMGDLFGDSNEWNDFSGTEKKVHSVTLDDFYIAAFELTQAEYESVMHANPSEYKGAKMPLGGIDWYGAVEFCNALSEVEGLNPAYIIQKDAHDDNNFNSSDDKQWLITMDLKSNGYRLPTEAEWEYAARSGGKKVRFGFGGDEIDTSLANYNGESTRILPYARPGTYRFHQIEVGQFRPNDLGLYDMSGNMWEWCWDWYGIESYDKQEGVKNPIGLKSGALRVLRGGSYWNSADLVRVSQRFQSDTWDNYHYFGFRLVRSKI